MNLYLYCSSGTLLEYFTLNKIVCNGYLSMKNRKVVPSLGLVSSKFLFLTPKKLTKTKRSFGFEQDDMEIPAALELSVPDHDAVYWPVLFVDEKGVVSDAFHPLSDLPEQSIGVFAEAEISFSFVSRILFDHENAADDIYRPSLDLYFPEHLYDIFDSSFSDELDTDGIRKAAGCLDRKYEDLDVCSLILKRTKAASITLNTILETRAWPFGEKHTANFDAITMELMGMRDELVRLMNGEKERIRDAEKDTVLHQIGIGEGRTAPAVFFQALIEELIPRSSPDFFRADFQAVTEKTMKKTAGAYTEEESAYIKTEIDRIEDFVYGSSREGLEAVMQRIDESWNVLKALIFFLRSPNLSEKLEDGLTAYKAAPEVRRYAWILFSALNGIEPIPADKKGNIQTMRTAEKEAMRRYPSESIVSVVSSEEVIGDRFMPAAEERITPDCIQSFFLSEATDEALKDLIKRFAKHKALSKGFHEDDYIVLSLPFDLINGLIEKHSETGITTKTEHKKFVASYQTYMKKAKEEYDTRRFLSDYLENKKRFLSIYQKDESFWKEAYQRGKKA